MHGITVGPVCLACPCSQLQLWVTALLLGVAYNGAAALLHGSSATASATSASAHCPAWNGLQMARDMASGNSHRLWCKARYSKALVYSLRKQTYSPTFSVDHLQGYLCLQSPYLEIFADSNWDKTICVAPLPLAMLAPSLAVNVCLFVQDTRRDC